jgi:hypothetical protein
MAWALSYWASQASCVKKDSAIEPDKGKVGDIFSADGDEPMICAMRRLTLLPVDAGSRQDRGIGINEQRECSQPEQHR